MKKEITFQSRKVSYNISGKGDCLLLIHGFMESKSMWNDLTNELEKKYTIISPDLPGHGESENFGDIHSMTLIAEIANEILVAENITRFVVCGHSMGGYAALQLARLQSEKVIGLILFHSHASADTEKAVENRRRMINIVKANKEGFILEFFPRLFDQKHVANYAQEIETMRKEAASMDKQSIIAALAGMRDRTDSLNFLLLSEIPILFIIGKQDSGMSYDKLFAQAILPSHSEILLLEDVGHMGYIEAKDITTKAVDHFTYRCFN